MDNQNVINQNYFGDNNNGYTSKLPNEINLDLFFNSETNKITSLENEIQANTFKDLISNISLIKTQALEYNKITEEMKFKSFDKYLKYFDNNGSNNKKKLSLIKTLYKNLFSTKQIKLNYILPDNMTININLQIIYEICENILIALNSLYGGKNSDDKLIKLISGEMGWKEACIKSKYKDDKEYNKFEKSIKYLEALSNFTCFNFDILSNINENKAILMEYILLIYLFFEPIFKNVIKININMNMDNLNKIYSENISMQKNLYKMDINSIVTQKEFLNGLLINFLLIKKLGDHFQDKISPILSYNQYDSYMIEIKQLINNEIMPYYIQEKKNFNFNLLYYSTFFNLAPKTLFNVHINALDPLLFKNVVLSFFNILSVGEPIQELEISLFPGEYENIKINYRKILLNILLNKNQDDSFIPFKYKENLLDFSFNKKYNWKNEDKNSLISVNEDNIIDILFEEFNKNLIYLLVILEKNYQSLKETLIINLPKELITKKKFVYTISYFIYNVFCVLFKKGLAINMSEFKVVTNIEIPENFSKFQRICLRDVQINNLKLKINNISNILDLSSLPYYSADLISLSNLSDIDLTYLINALRSKKETQTKIKHLKLKFGYSLYNNNVFSLIDNMLREYSFPKSICYLTLRFKNELGFNEYANILWKITNAIANSEDNPKDLRIVVKLYYDAEESENVPYREVKQALTNCFDLEKLNENYIMIYNFALTKINNGNVHKEIMVEINKYRRGVALDTFIKLTNRIDRNHKMEMRYMMPSCLRIVKFISKIKPESNIKIFFNFIKSE